MWVTIFLVKRVFRDVAADYMPPFLLYNKYLWVL